MTQILTGADSYNNNATAPADGDTRNAASVTTPMQTILNNTRYLYKHGRYVTSDFTYSGSTSGTTTTSYTTALTENVTGLEVGDIVLMMLSETLRVDSSGVSTQGYSKLMVSEATESDTDQQIYVSPATSSDTNYPHTLLGRYEVQSQTSISIKLQSYVSVADGANNFTTHNNLALAYLVVRP